MSADQEAAIIKKLKDYIDGDQNIDTKILTYDWNFQDIRHPQAVLLDRDAKDAVYGVAFHSYDWKNNDESNITQLHNSYPNLKMFHTEGGMWGTRGMDLIVKMFRHHISTYIGWVTILDNDNVDDGDEDEQYPGTATPPPFILDSSNTDNYWITPTYYLKQQFSKFIQLGAKRIYSNIGAHHLSNVAFLNPDGTIVMIVVNQDENQRELRVINNSKQFIARIPGKTVVTYKWNSPTIIP